MIKSVEQAYKIFVVLSFLAVAGCSNGQAEDTVSPYDRVCSIYEEELDGKASAGPATFQKLSDRLSQEVPELEEQLNHLTNFPKEEFYPALKSMAEHHTGKSWECKFIKNRYKR
jgi:hypothetical protein